MTNQKFLEHLKKRNLYCTPERARLFDVLESQNVPCSITKLIALTATRMNETTVYRNLEIFERIGVINRVYSGWKYKVELSDTFSTHHHHMTCTNCGSVTSFQESEELLQELEKLESQNKFTATTHSLEIKGLCSHCC